MLDLIIVDIFRFVVSLILLSLAVRSFLKTRIPAMFYVSVGFALITFGHMFADLYFYNNVHMNRLLSELFETMGLIALIIAVIKI